MVKALCQRIRQGDAEASEACSECSNRPFSGWQLLLQNAMYI